MTRLNGIVTRGHGNRFVVFSEGTYYSCTVRKKVKYLTNLTTPVAVGDDVYFELTNTEVAVGVGAEAGLPEGVIVEIQPRRSVLSRPAVGREQIEHVLAANVDSLAVVTSISEPILKPGLIDRFLIAAAIGNLEAAIVVNKIDLKGEFDPQEIANIYRPLGIDLFLTSAEPEGENASSDSSGNEINLFREYLRTHRTVLAGHSGVGKSSLLNRIYPGMNLKTSAISQRSGRGRHTTSHMELYHLPGGGAVIDSPGIKVLGLWQLDKKILDEYYPEMENIRTQCRFTGCSHIPEPNCAVKDAVKNGDISELRYNNYIQIYQSL